MKTDDATKPLSEILSNEGLDGNHPTSKFFELMFGPFEKNNETDDEEDCPDEENDCDEVVACPECEGTLSTVFGSLPLEVECSECGQKYKLRDLL